MINKLKDNDRGFTLIELLIVIAIIGFLAAAILVAVDPVKRVQQARNATRWSEVNGLLNAILVKQVDDRRSFNGASDALINASSTAAQVIVSDISSPTAVDCSAGDSTRPACPGLPAGVSLSFDTATSCIANLVDIETDGYLAEIPLDPIGDGNFPEGYESNLAIGDNNSGYYIQKLPNGRIEIGSCFSGEEANSPETIRVKR
jgi:prepilin-type N-terminal cleavage/methylation domain-containing protein